MDNEQRLQEKPSIPVAPESSTEHVNVLEMSLTAGTVEFRTGEVEPDVRVSVDEMQIDQNLSWERRNLLLAINQLYESFITKGESVEQTN